MARMDVTGLLAAAAAACVVLAGCGGHDSAGAPSSTPAPAGPERVVLKPVDAKGNLQNGWSQDESHRDTPVDCWGTSPYDVGSGIRWCGGTADSGDACWPTDNGAAVLCLADPFSTTLYLRNATGLGDPSEPRSGDAVPMALALDDGTQCRAVIGGSWGQRGAPAYTCGKGAELIGIWGTSPDDASGIHRGPDGWTVEVGTETGTPTKHTVAKAYYVGTA